MALVHGYVTGELIYSRADGSDPDRFPDVVPASDVKLTFTPAARQFVDPDGRLVVADPIPAAVMDDGQVTGDLDGQGNAAEEAEPGLWLVVGKYRVTAKGHYRDFDITVTEEHTEQDPLVLGESIEYVPPTVTVQSVTVPKGASDGQVLGWQDGGLAWVVGGDGGDGGPVAWDNVQDKPATFPPDLSGVTANDVGARPFDYTPSVGDVPNLPASKITTGTFNAARIPSLPYATEAQGGKADTAVQPNDLHTVAFTGSYDDLTDKPSGGGGGDFSGDYDDLTNKPDLDSLPYRPDDWTPTAAQVGARADNWTPAVGDIPNLPASKINSGTFDAARIPALDYAATDHNHDGTYQPAGSYATAAQGALADTAVQPAAIADFITAEDIPAPTLATIPPGVTLTVYHAGTWPSRPTSRLDIPVMWIDDAGTAGIPTEFEPTVDAIIIPADSEDPAPPEVTPLDVYNFEDQVDGQALTTSGDWSTFGTGALLATNTVVAHGTLGGHMANASPYFYLDYHPWSESPSSEAVVMECYFRRETAGAATTLMQLNNSGTNQGNLRILADGTVQIRDTTTQVAVSTETLSDGTWYRIAWLTSSSGQEARVYVDESTTPYFTLSGALSDNTHSSVRIGATAAASGTEFYIDTIRVATEWLAPAGA